MTKQPSTSNIIDTLEDASYAGLSELGNAMGQMAYNLVSGNHNVKGIYMCGESFRGIDFSFSLASSRASFMDGLLHRGSGAGRAS